MTENAYSVQSLADVKLPWLVRRKLRRAKKKGLTGVLVYGVIRTPVRGVTFQPPGVSVLDETGRLLGLCTPQSKLPKWFDLPPGPHRLKFLAGQPKSSSSFYRDVDLHSGEVVVAVCEPVQPWVFYAHTPSMDRWYIGIR